MDDAERIGRIDENVKFIRSRLDELLEEHEEVDRRVTVLERAFWIASGFVAVGGGLIGLVVHFIK